ncbi:MAG: YabP/YqfC family sporulation protein [Clostridia bacterium]|nr:YabP/YqfC family sporulation protein [Clostridia bacterium]
MKGKDTVKDAVKKEVNPMFSRFHMEITGKGKEKRVFIEGVKKILICTQTKILLLHLEEICFMGENMQISAYSGGALEITGIIDEILFSYQKGKKERKNEDEKSQ